MKKLKAIFWLLAFSSLLATCKKEPTDEEQLPAATQTGANTFGCLINGKIYIPKGSTGTFQSNFQVIVDPGFSDGSFGVITFRKLNNTTTDFAFGSDSIKTTGLYIVKYNGRTSFNYSESVSGNVKCSTLSKNELSAYGFVKITRYDLNDRIFSGEFEFHFSNPACSIGDPIHITQGRFDYKL